MSLLRHAIANLNEVKIKDIYHLSFTWKVCTLVQKDIRLITVHIDFYFSPPLLDNFVPGFVFNRGSKIPQLPSFRS